MGRGQRSHLAATKDLRRSSIPKATEFIESFGEMAEWSEIDCNIGGATMHITECPEASDEVKEAMDIIGMDYDRSKTWEASIEMITPESGDGVTISTQQPSRDLALATILAVEDCLLRNGKLLASPEVKILSYPYGDSVPAMIWADVSLPEIGKINLLSSGDNLHSALYLMRNVLPLAEMPN